MRIQSMPRQQAQRECALVFARQAGIFRAFGKPLSQLSTPDILLVVSGLREDYAQSREFERCVEQKKSSGLSKEAAIKSCQEAFENSRNR